MTERARDDADHAAWLLARESGQPGPAVSDATAARYTELQALIADLPATPAGVVPRAGWQQDVLAAIDAAEAEPAAPRPPAPASSGDPARVNVTGEAAGVDPAGARLTGEAAGADPSANPTGEVTGVDPAPANDPARPGRTRARPRRWAVATAVLAAAAVAAIAVYRYRGERPDGPAAGPAIAFEVARADRPHRSAEPSVGDQLIIRAVVAGAGELRVYDAAGLEAARCTAPTPACTVERSGPRATLRLTLPLRAPGVLRAVLFAAPLAGPSGRMDLDLEAAVRAGIGVTTREQEVH